MWSAARRGYYSLQVKDSGPQPRICHSDGQSPPPICEGLVRFKKGAVKSIIIEIRGCKEDLRRFYREKSGDVEVISYRL